MNEIRILPEVVASQIAAGEVIDRPASVVRELTDNSIDATADRISIQIDRGGKGLIKVSDNGAGMGRDDLLLCVERHATSKIEKAADLFSISSLGFRGEAIPSIASVSQMEIVTRPKTALAGHKLKINGGKLKSIEETGSPAGTIVAVKNLFFNVPARRRFLRAVRTETDHIVNVFSRIALPFTGIAFRLDASGKTLLNFPASGHTMPRLATLMGRQVAASLIEAQEETPEMKIHAYLSPPELSRSRWDRLFIYVNRRNIHDRLIARALGEGYGQRLMKGQYPQAVLLIEIDPHKIDVNIHPAKQEIRFHDGRTIMKTVAATVDRALSKKPHFFSHQGTEREERHPEATGWMIAEPVRGYQQTERPLLDPLHVPVETNRQRELTSWPIVIGQLGETYILLQTGDGLLIMDQHAAHERIVYETLKKGLHGSNIESQRLLVPFKLELSVNEKRIALEKMEELPRFGLELDHFGGNTFLLRAVPALLKNVHWDSFISEFLGELKTSDLEDDVLLDKALTIMACHGAIRSGKRMSYEEMTQLLDRIKEMDLPTNCPHGRPIFQHIPYRDIERMFKRVL